MVCNKCIEFKPHTVCKSVFYEDNLEALHLLRFKKKKKTFNLVYLTEQLMDYSG